MKTFKVNNYPRIAYNLRDPFFSDVEYAIKVDSTFEEVAEELTNISLTLIEMMPDPSIGPQERLERLARVVPSSIMKSAYRRNARAKLNDLKNRLNELVPQYKNNSQAQLDFLKSELSRLVPEEIPDIEKLEKIGDHRSTDIGVSPRKWN